MTPGRRDLLLAALSGLGLGAAFLPLPLGALAWFALVPLLLALQHRADASGGARFRLGYAGGLVFFLAGTHWIALLSDMATPLAWLKYLGWVLASAYLALFWGLAAWLAGALARRSGVPVRWAFVPAMLLVEELRGSGELGFPWFQPGYTQHALPALHLASLGGVTLVTAWLLALNAALAGAFAGRARGPAALALPALLLAAGLGLPAFHGPREDSGPPARVALVQGSIPGEIKWSGNHQGEILATFLALSDTAMSRRDAAGIAPSLVIWPETATGSYLRKQLDQSIAVARWAAANGAAVFTGFADYSYDAKGTPQAWNAAGQWTPEGPPAEVYAKRHLVPFGERIPFQALLPVLGRLDLGQAEWMPGTRTVLFPGAAGPFSCLVCFESIFPGLARRDVLAGSRMLVIVTNDEWFGNSAALYQHADMAPFRAVENGVPLLRCANTGLTEIIGPDGSVRARAPVFTPCVLAGEVPRGYRGTPFRSLGDWPGLLAALSAAALAIAPWRRGRSPR